MVRARFLTSNQRQELEQIVRRPSEDYGVARRAEVSTAPGPAVPLRQAVGFGPTRPWLVTRDEVPDPQDLSMWIEVDGHRYQDGSTRTMHFDVATVISHLSQFMSLQPGDIISTGTPPGFGMGQKPGPVYLRPGQGISRYCNALRQNGQ